MARFRRRHALALALTLMATGCSDQSGVSRATRVDKDSLPGEGKAFIQPAADDESLGAPIDLLEWGTPKLVDLEGWDPTKAKGPSLALAVGQSQPFELELSGELRPSMGPTKLEKQKQPTVRVRGRVHVDAFSAAGAQLRVAVAEVELRAEGGDPIGIGRASQRILRASRLLVDVDTTGLVTGATLAMPARLDASLHPHLPLVAGMAAGLARLFVPRPAEPKIGQKWTVVDSFLDAGAVITQRSSFEVSQVDSSAEQMEATLAVEATGKWWDRHPHESYDLSAYSHPELPGLVEPVSFELEGRGHGRLRLNPKEALPLEGMSGLIRNTRTVVEHEGAQQEAAIEQEIRLVYGRAKAPVR